MVSFITNTWAQASTGNLLIEPKTSKQSIAPAKPTTQNKIVIKTLEPSKITMDFYRAVESGNLELADLMLDKGPDINCQNCGGPSLLFLYAHKGNEKTIKWLLNRGANINLQDRQGLTVLYVPVLNALNMAVLGQSQSAYDETLKAVAFYLNSGANPKLADKEGNTPLHFASRYINYTGNGDAQKEAYVGALFSILIEKGADINALNIQKRNPLAYGMKKDLRGFVECNKYLTSTLIERGSIINQVDINGETAYDTAYSMALDGKKQCNLVLPLLKHI